MTLLNVALNAPVSLIKRLFKRPPLDPVRASLASASKAAEELSRRQALIPMHEISDVCIINLLNLHHMKVDISGDDVVHSETLSGLRFAIGLHPESHLIQYWLCHRNDFGLEPDVLRERVALVNRALTVVRASVDPEDDLILTAYISYHGGLLPSQFMHMLAMFERRYHDALEIVRGHP